jgi:hypothetical protein
VNKPHEHGDITTYEHGDVWMVAQNDQWVPGVYDSEEAALFACKFDNAQLEMISDVWEVGGEDRPATMRDLRSVERLDEESRDVIDNAFGLGDS